jgi:hypothetical protein
MDKEKTNCSYSSSYIHIWLLITIITVQSEYIAFSFSNRNMLLNCPKLGVDSNVSLPVSQYQEALKATEKPSSEDEVKPGFVKMMTNVGAIVCENYLVGDGKDWVSALKKKADEIASKSGDVEMYSPGGGSELLGSLHNVAVNLSTESVPPTSADTPESKEPFFGVFTTDNKWESLDIHLDGKKVSVSLKFGALARVSVEPDKKWYDSAYLYTLAKQNSWNPPFTTESVFGEKGLLSQRINGLIAAYHVAFKITVSPETYEKFEKHFTNARGVRIGPLSFGAGSLPSTIPGVSPKQPTPTPIKPKADPFTQSFVGEHMADHPAIVGLTVARILPEKY